jgi:hypothetical protein
MLFNVINIDSKLQTNFSFYFLIKLGKSYFGQPVLISMTFSLQEQVAIYRITLLYCSTKTESNTIHFPNFMEPKIYIFCFA